MPRSARKPPFGRAARPAHEWEPWRNSAVGAACMAARNRVRYVPAPVVPVAGHGRAMRAPTGGAFGGGASDIELRHGRPYRPPLRVRKPGCGQWGCGWRRYPAGRCGHRPLRGAVNYGATDAALPYVGAASSTFTAASPASGAFTPAPPRRPPSPAAMWSPCASSAATIWQPPLPAPSRLPSK